MDNTWSDLRGEPETGSASDWLKDAAELLIRTKGREYCARCHEFVLVGDMIRKVEPDETANMICPDCGQILVADVP